MSKFTEATLVGVFNANTLTALSRPLHGARWRHTIGLAEGFVSDVLTYCGKNVNPDDVVAFVEESIGDSSATLVIDDDHEAGPRAVVYHLGEIAAETGVRT